MHSGMGEGRFLNGWELEAGLRSTSCAGCKSLSSDSQEQVAPMCLNLGHFQRWPRSE